MKRNRRKNRRRSYSPSKPVYNRTGWVYRPHVSIDKGLVWLAIWTAPQAERKAEINLRRAGFSTYLPSFADSVVKKGRSSPVERVAVGRYLFVGVEPDASPGEVSAALRNPYDEPLGSLISVDARPLPVCPDRLQAFADGLSSSRVIIRGGVLGRLLAIMGEADDARLRMVA